MNENLFKVQNNILPGSVAFKLYDTYGFPVDLTADILKTKNIKVDNVAFESEMEKNKVLAELIGKVLEISQSRKNGLK